MTFIGELPLIVFVVLTGYMLYYKSRSIAVPVIIMLAFMTSVGAVYAAQLGIVGMVLGGAFILGIVAVYLKFFY